MKFQDMKFQWVKPALRSGFVCNLLQSKREEKIG